MRGVFLFFLALGLVGCGRSPGPSEAAVHVQASYDFKAGCISVEVHDKDAPAKSKTENIVVSGRPPPAKVDLAVFRAADWGSQLVITVTARERLGNPRWLHAAQSYFHDVVPCRALGIPVAWINRRHETPPDGGRPTREMATLVDLAAWLA